MQFHYVILSELKLHTVQPDMPVMLTVDCNIGVYWAIYTLSCVCQIGLRQCHQLHIWDVYEQECVATIECAYAAA